MPSSGQILVHRAPVLTLWAAIVAHRLGFDLSASLSLGRVFADLKQVTHPLARVFLKSHEIKFVLLMTLAVPVRLTSMGLRALNNGQPVRPKSVEYRIARAFGHDLSCAYAAMDALAASYSVDEINAYGHLLFERFCPDAPPGERGWGAKGVLDLKRIAGGAKQSR